MKTAERFLQFFSRPDRLSYVFMLLLLVLTAGLHLANLLLAALFSYLALNLLQFRQRVSKWLTVILFVVLVSGVVYLFGHFIRHGVHALPEIADKAIPSVIEWAKKYEIELPFADYDGLRETAMDTAKSQAHYLGSFARVAREAGKQVIFVMVGCVAAISLFLNSRFELGREPHTLPNNLYSLAGEHLGVRFRRFFESFSTVIGAQIVISAINTFFTTVFALAVDLPYTPLVIGVTFLCGLVPVLGNLVSNTIIVGIGFTVSPQMAFSALIFLVVIHKLEYFLNSKIIGRRIRNPLWLTLIGLVVGEKLMGLPGMILAPVVLHYLKVEASSFEVKDEEPEEGAPLGGAAKPAAGAT